ncbi:MAG: Rieske (2Fe-2S) protein [Gammaproteobacteria bacterium]|nr:Rieske (2Fe-2S) protein [Gammaproteobacteria bacterium]
MRMPTNLDPRYYVDPALFERERRSIFRRHWQMLGPVSRLHEPGAYVTVNVAGWKLFALRGHDGVLRGFHNVCRHRGARLLAEGAGKCHVLRCPYHNWSYDQAGSLRQAPAFGEDPDFRLEDWPLEKADLSQWRGLLFISIGAEMSLIDQLGDLPAEVEEFPLETYVAMEEQRFTMRSNWKTYTDNFVEGYHIPGIHPGFMKVIDFKNFETTALNGMVRMTSPQRDGSIYGGKWLWMWPNWTLSIFPGGMNTSRINPLDVGSTELIYDFYFSDTSAELATSRRNTIDTNCGIVREDFGICESTQENYASGGYTPGPLSPRHEKSVAYFQTMVRTALSASVNAG